MGSCCRFVRQCLGGWSLLGLWAWLSVMFLVNVELLNQHSVEMRHAIVSGPGTTVLLITGLAVLVLAAVFRIGQELETSRE